MPSLHTLAGVCRWVGEEKPPWVSLNWAGFYEHPWLTLPRSMEISVPGPLRPAGVGKAGSEISTEQISCEIIQRRTAIFSSILLVRDAPSYP